MKLTSHDTVGCPCVNFEMVGVHGTRYISCISCGECVYNVFCLPEEIGQPSDAMLVQPIVNNQ
jgi:hypothetical protein